MPTAYPQELRAAIVRAARSSNSPHSHIARAYGVSPSCLYRWLRFEEPDAGDYGEPDEPRTFTAPDLGRLKQENAVLRLVVGEFVRQARTDDLYPLVALLASRDVQVVQACELLGVPEKSFFQWRRQSASDAAYDVVSGRPVIAGG